MPIPLPPQLSEGAPKDNAVSTAAASNGRPRHNAGRRRLVPALVACFGSVLLAGGAVNRALDPLAGEVCTGVTVKVDAAPPLGNPGAPAYLPPNSFMSGPLCVLGGHAEPTSADRELVRKMRETPRPPEARLGRIAEGFRPDPFVPLPR